MTYPKAWLTEVRSWLLDNTHKIRHGHYPEDFLRAMYDVGALKDPPKPREWLVCPHYGVYAEGTTVCPCHGDKLIYVREVEES